MARFILLVLRKGNCPACNGTGGISDFGNKVNCSRCNGTGNVK